MASTFLTSVIIMVAGVITGFLSGRVLGPEGKGYLVTLTVWSGTLLYALTFGISEATAFFAARMRGAARVWATAHVVVLVLGSAVTLAGYWLLPLILHGQPQWIQRGAQLYFVAYVIPSLASLSATAWLQGCGEMVWFNISRASTHVVAALLMLAFTIAHLRTTPAFAFALLAGNAVTWPVAAFGKRRLKLRSAKPAKRLAAAMLSYGAKVQIGSWSSMANLRLDQLLLTLVVPPAALGVYAISVSYAGLLGIVPGAVSLFAFRSFVSDFSDGRGAQRFIDVYRRSFWVMILAGLALVTVAPRLIPLVFGSGYQDAVILGFVLVPAAILTGTNQLISSAFRAAGKPGTPSRAEAVGLVITVGLLALLLPKFGAWGAAFASLAAYGGTTVFLFSQLPLIQVPRLALFTLRGSDLEDLRVFVRDLLPARSQ